MDHFENSNRRTTHLKKVHPERYAEKSPENMSEKSKRKSLNNWFKGLKIKDGDGKEAQNGGVDSEDAGSLNTFQYVVSIILWTMIGASEI